MENTAPSSPQSKNYTKSGAEFILCIGVEKIMSEKQRFNKDIQNRQIAENRRERWMSRKILTEILENIRLQRNDANWVLYQVFTKENLTYKSKIKIWNHLMRAGYDLAQEKPQKESEIFSYKEAWKEYKGNAIKENLKNASLMQKMTEENQWCPAFQYPEKYNINYEGME